MATVLVVDDDRNSLCALRLAKFIPERFSATSGPSNRKAKVFVDYLRNGMGQTTVAAFQPVSDLAVPTTRTTQSHVEHAKYACVAAPPTNCRLRQGPRIHT